MLAVAIVMLPLSYGYRFPHTVPALPERLSTVIICPISAVFELHYGERNPFCVLSLVLPKDLRGIVNS